MDPAKYWMITRRNLGDQKAPVFSTPHLTVGGSSGDGSSASYYESWEERAFAEDSAANLGGCIWPPRSYPCSFCGREFRSAQALGGHMNVHRRDRARLRLSGAVEDGANENHGIPPHQRYMIQPIPPQIGVPQQEYGPKPSAPSPSTDTNLNSICSILAYPSRSLVQAAAARTVWGKPVLSAPLALPSPAKEYGKKEMFLCAAKLTQDRNQAARMCSDQELCIGSGELRLSVLGYRTRGNLEDEDEADDEHIIHTSRKRRRVDVEVTPLVLPSSKHLQQDGIDNHRAKVLKLCPSSPVEELDLELRL